MAQIVDDENDTSRRTLASEVKSFLIGFHGVDGTHERRIETVQCRNQVSDTHDTVELDHAFREQLGLLCLEGSSCKMSAC